MKGCGNVKCVVKQQVQNIKYKCILKYINVGHTQKTTLSSKPHSLALQNRHRVRRAEAGKFGLQRKRGTVGG